MAIWKKKRRTKNKKTSEPITEEIENAVEEAIEEAVGELKIKTNKERAMEIKKQLEKNLSAYDAVLRDQLISSTKRMFSKLTLDTSRAFGAMKGAEISEDVRKHVNAIVKMIENSFLYDLGESKDNIAESVSKKNAEFMNKVIENLSKDMAQGKIYQGPQTDKDLSEMSQVWDDAFERLNDLSVELSESGEVDKKIISLIGDLMHSVGSGLPEEKVFAEINKALGNETFMSAAPEVKTILDNIIRNYKSFSTENFKEEVDAMQEFHDEQNKISQTLAFNMDLFVGGIAATVAGFAMFANDIKESEKQLYAIAAISDMTAPQIGAFRSEMMSLAVETPFAANVMTEAYGELVRTGKTAEESMTILKGVTDLAIASFEPLEKVASAVNSLMLAMEMSADKAAKVSSSLFSVLNATPLGFESLNNALTQTGAAFNAVIGQTSKTGEELDNYKMRMTDLQASMIGGMSLLGKTGSQAGTAIRNMTTRLSSMETAAKVSLQADLDKIGGFSYEGSYVRTHEDITALAQEDFGKVTEMLSQMVKQGALSFDTLRKMFTGRNVTQIVGVLSQIDGNLDSFVKSMTGDADALAKATEIASKSWVQQYEQFTQIISDMKTSLGGGMEIFGSALFHINSLLSGVAKISAESPLAAAALTALGSVIVTFATITAASQAKIAAQSMFASIGLTNISKGLSKITDLKTAFTVLGAGVKTAVSSIGLVAGALISIVAVGAAIYTMNKKYKAAQDALKDSIEKNIKADLNRQKSLERSTKTLDDISKEFNSLKSFSLGDDLTKKMKPFMYGMNESASAVSSLTQALATFIDVVKTSKETLGLYSDTGGTEKDIEAFFAKKESNAQTKKEKEEVVKKKEKAIRGRKIMEKRAVDFKSEAEKMGMSFSKDHELGDISKIIQLAGESINLKTGEIDKDIFNQLIEKDEEFAISFKEKLLEYSNGLAMVNEQFKEKTAESGYYSAIAEKNVNAEKITKPILTLLPHLRDANFINSNKTDNDDAKLYIDTYDSIEKEIYDAKKAEDESLTLLISNALSVRKGNDEALQKEIVDLIKPYDAKDNKELKEKINKIKTTKETETLGKNLEIYYKEYIALYGEVEATGAGFERYIIQKGRALANAKAVDTVTMAELLKSGNTEDIKKINNMKDELIKNASMRTSNGIQHEIEKLEKELREVDSENISTNLKDKKTADINKKITDLNKQKELFLEKMSGTLEIEKKIEKDKKALDELLTIDKSKRTEDQEKKIKELEKSIATNRDQAFFENFNEIIKSKDLLEKSTSMLSNNIVENIGSEFDLIAKIMSGEIEEGEGIKKLPEIQKKLEEELKIAKEKGEEMNVYIINMILNALSRTPSIVNSELAKSNKKIDMKLISTRLKELNNEIERTILSMLPDSSMKFHQIANTEKKDLIFSSFQDIQSMIAGKVNDADLGLNKKAYEDRMEKLSKNLSMESIIKEYEEMLTNSSLKLSSSERKSIKDKIAELKNQTNKSISDYIGNFYDDAVSKIEDIFSGDSYSLELAGVVDSIRDTQHMIIDGLEGVDAEAKKRLKENLDKTIARTREMNFSRMAFDSEKDLLMSQLDRGRYGAASDSMGRIQSNFEEKNADALAYRSGESKLKNNEKLTEDEKKVMEKYNSSKENRMKIIDLRTKMETEEIRMIQLQSEIEKRNAERLVELYGQLGSHFENAFLTMMGYGDTEKLSSEGAIRNIGSVLGSVYGSYSESGARTEGAIGGIDKLLNLEDKDFLKTTGVTKTPEEVKKLEDKKEKIKQDGAKEQDEILKAGFSMLATGLMNLAAASGVEKQIEKINNRLRDIDQRQKAIERKKQMADDIQEKAAIFNEEQLLQSEKMNLELEMQKLEEQEMMAAQTQELVNIVNEIRALRADTATYANNKNNPDGSAEGGNAPSGLMGMATKVTDFFKGEDGGFSMDKLTSMFSGGEGKGLDIMGGLKNAGSNLMDGLIDGVKGMAGGIGNKVVNGLVTKWTDDAALGQTLGGLTQGIAGIVTLNPMDILQGGMDALAGLGKGIFGDKKAEKKISKAIEENNRKIADAVEDFNFQAMMAQLQTINSGIRMVSQNVVKYGLKGSYQFYASQAGGSFTGSGAAQYVSHTESYGGSWFRRRRRKDVYAAVTETMDLKKIGDYLGGDYESALSDYRLNSADEMKLALEGAKKIQQGLLDWRKDNAWRQGDKGESGKLWAQSQASMDATNQIIAKLEHVQNLYTENLDKFNSQLFGFTVEFIDEFGNVAESTEEIADVIVTEWQGLSDILSGISSNMFNAMSNIGESIYSAVFGGISESLAKSDTMVELGGELANVIFELSKTFLPNDMDTTGLNANLDRTEIMGNLLDVMNQMKEEEEKLKEFAQTVSEGMLALGGDIKELRPYLSIDFQTIETQVSHYQEKFNEAFDEVKTDIFNSFMNGADVNISTKNLEEFNVALEDYIKSQQAAKDTTDYIADEYTDKFLSGETKYPFEDVSEYLNKKFVEVRDIVKEFFNAEDFDSAVSGFGSSIGSKVIDNILEKMLDTSKYKTALADIYKNVDSMMNKGTMVSFKDLAQLAQDTQKYGMMLDQERQKIQAMRDLFDFNSEVVYDTTQDTINYQTSSSKESVYNIYQTNNFDIGNFVSTKATMEEFADMVAPYMAKSFDNLGLS